MVSGAFLRIDDLEMHVHAARNGGEMPVAVHLLFGIGQADTAITVMVVDRVFGIVRQFLVKNDRM